MKLKFKILAIFFVVFTLISAPAVIFAQNKYSADDTSVVATDEVVEGDYFAAGERVQIDGVVQGDVYAAGGNIIINGVVEGDVLVAGGNIKIQGEVNHDVRAAGGQIDINGTVAGSVTTLAGNVDISKDAKIGAGLVTAAGNVYLDGMVDKNIEAAVGSLVLGSNAQVSGNVNYASESDLDVDSTASVSGQITKHQTPEVEMPSKQAVQDFFFGLDFAGKVISVITTLLIGLLLIHFFPRYVENATKIVTNSFGKTLLVGFITMIAAPFIFVILLFTIIGIPISIVFGFALFIWMYLGRIYVVIALGRKSLQFINKENKPNLNMTFLIGAIVYYLLTLIPIIGGITKLLIVLSGLGTEILARRDFYMSARKEKLL